MVVVMGIIALLLAIGVGALISARNQGIASDMAEQLKSDIRKTQVRAMATEGNCGGGVKPKMWGIDINQSTNRYSLAFYCAGTGQWTGLSSEPNNYNTDIVISGGYAPTNLSFIFSSPVGAMYQLGGTLTGGSGQQVPGSYDESYCPSVSGGCTNITSDREITFTYRGISFRVLVNGTTGQARVQ